MPPQSRLDATVPLPVGGEPTESLDGGQPTVTVCVCTRLRPDDLARTLASLGQSTYPITQIVVSDDGHDEATAAVCRAAVVEVEYVLGPGLGLGANRNRAIAASTGDVVLFLDDDCLLREEFLDRAIERLRSAERRHGSGRVIVSGRESNRGDLVTAAGQSFLGFQSKPYVGEQRIRSVVINATVFPAALLRAHPFDPRLVYGYEEVDLASRATASGYVIVECPHAINDHHPSDRGRERNERYVEASRLYVTLRRYALTDRAPFRALAFAVAAPVHVLAANLRQFGPRGLRPTATTLGLAAAMLWQAR